MESLANIESLASEIRGSNIRDLALPAIRARVQHLIASQLFPSATFDWHTTFARARVLPPGKSFENLPELIYPLQPNSDFGRANIPGRHVLYSSANKSTALEEVNAAPGMKIMVVMFRPKDGKRLDFSVIGELESALSAGKTRMCSDTLVNDVDSLLNSDRDRLYKFVYIDSFLSEMFGRMNAVGYSHAVTATVAEILFERGRGGILFESVRRNHGWNQAIERGQFDQSCEIMAVEELKVNAVYKYGLYDCEHLRITDSLGTQGEIQWDKGSNFTAQWNLRSGVTFPRALRGWSPLQIAAYPLDN